MADYKISLTDRASAAAGTIRSSISAMRKEIILAAHSEFQLAAASSRVAAAASGLVSAERAAASAARQTVAANNAAASSARTRGAAESALSSKLKSVSKVTEGLGLGSVQSMMDRVKQIREGLGELGVTESRMKMAAGGVAVGVGGYVAVKSAIAGLSMVAPVAGAALSALGSIISSVASVAGQLAWAFGQATIAAFDFRTRAVMAFQAMTGNGEREFGKLKTLAVEMGTSLEGTFDGIRALTAAGFKSDDATRWFKRLQDMKGLGLTQETLGRVTLAVSQIKGAGVLQGDELRQLQETGLNIDLVWQSIAKKMGVTVAEAKKAKEAGKVTAEVALAGIETAMAQMAGGGAAGTLGAQMGRKTVEGFAGRLGLLKGLLFEKLAGGSAGEGISGLLESLNTAADGLLTWFDSKDAGAMFDEIGLSLHGLGSDLAAFVGSDFAKSMAGDLKDLGMGLFRVYGAWWDLVKSFAEGFGGKGVMDLHGFKDTLAALNGYLRSDSAKKFFSDLGFAAREWVDFFSPNTLMEKEGGFSAAAEGLGNSAGRGLANGILSAMAAMPGMMFASGMTAAQSMISGLIGGIAAGIPMLSGYAATMGSTVKSAVMGSIDAHSSSRDFEQIAGYATQGMAREFVANDNAAVRAARGLGRNVLGAAQGGLGASAYGGMGGGGAAPMLAGGSTTKTITINAPITIQGNADSGGVEQLEAHLLSLFERVA